VLHDGVLRPELFEQRSGESVELLQKAGGAGSSDESNARRAAFRFDRDYAGSGGDSRDFALAEHRRRSGVLATQSSRFAGTSLLPTDLNLP
jgi:hypothetical protein